MRPLLAPEAARRIDALLGRRIARSLPTLALRTVALLLSGATALPAITQKAPPSTIKLFVPDTLVPLSQFAHKDASAPLTLTVAPEILRWIETSAAEVGQDPLDHLFVAVQTGDSISYRAPDAWTRGTSGAVTISGDFAGDCVIVSDFLLHDPRVVTHWNGAANGGRGGQAIGARDGIYTWDCVFLAGATPAQTLHRLNLSPIVGPRGGAFNTDAGWGDPPGSPSPRPYHFASDRFALFSDGSLAHETATVPGYERYVAETYSWSSYTPLAAIWLSDRARQLTGFPIAHRNYPTAFPGFGGPADVRPGQRVVDDLPVFQIVHGHLVTPEEKPSSPPGYERSLATFILPPGWTSRVAPATYPVLFNGYYDINDNTFQGEGLRFIYALSRLHDQLPARTVVGLLWNGGGGAGSQTLQRSAYDNAARLFDDAVDLLRADKHLMVFSGSSRGATTVLAIASNPYRDTAPSKYDYRAVFVSAGSPLVQMGTAVTTFTTPSHPGLVTAVDNYTGYRGSWRPSWRAPPGLEQGFGDVELRDLFGTADAATVDRELSIDSPCFRSGLRAAGTGVVLRIGTHDHNGPSVQLVRYVNHLRAETTAPVPVLCQLFYRLGHEIPPASPDEATLLNMAISGTPLSDRNEYYATDPENPSAPREIAPPYIPLAVELPSSAGATQPHTWEFVGEPGSAIRVRLRQVVDTPCFAPPSSLGPERTASLTLSGKRGEIGSGWIDSASIGPLAVGPWWYEVDYDWNADGVFDRTLGIGDVALPTLALPEMCIESHETLGTTFGMSTSGLAEDQRFLPDPAPATGRAQR